MNAEVKIPKVISKQLDSIEWMRAAHVALMQGQSLNEFVLHCHPDNRRKAVKGYKAMRKEIRYGMSK